MIRTKFRRSYLGTAVLVCALLSMSSAVANAYTISLTGGSSGGNPGSQPLYEVSGLVQGDGFNVSWGGVTGLDAAGMVTIESLTDTNASIRVMLDNNSTPISGSNPRVTIMGMVIDAFSSFGSTATGGTYLDDAFNSNFPGFGTLPCASSGSNCANGGSGGIPAGSSDDFTLQVNGNFLGTLTLSEFALKIQGGPSSPDGDSYELAGVPSAKIPEPTTIALAVLGVVTFWMRRRPQR